MGVLLFFVGEMRSGTEVDGIKLGPAPILGMGRMDLVSSMGTRGMLGVDSQRSIGVVTGSQVK